MTADLVNADYVEFWRNALKLALPRPSGAICVARSRDDSNGPFIRIMTDRLGGARLCYPRAKTDAAALERLSDDYEIFNRVADAERALGWQAGALVTYLAAKSTTQAAMKFKQRTLANMTMGEMIGRPRLGNSKAADDAFLAGHHSQKGLRARRAADEREWLQKNNRSAARLGKPYKAPPLKELLDHRKDWLASPDRSVRGWVKAAAHYFGDVSPKTIRRLVLAAERRNRR